MTPNRTSGLIRVDRLKQHPKVGTKCFFRHEVLGVEGWGVIAEPQEIDDSYEIPVFFPWRGTLTGGVHKSQIFLGSIVPELSILPGENVYRLLAAILLWVEPEESDKA